MQSMPPLVIISSPAAGRGPAAVPAARPRSRAALASPSVAEYCSATAASSAISRGGDLREHVAGEGRRIREPAGERDDVGGPGQGQDRGDLAAAERVRAAGELAVQSRGRRRGSGGHGLLSSRCLSIADVISLRLLTADLTNVRILAVRFTFDNVCIQHNSCHQPLTTGCWQMTTQLSPARAGSPRSPPPSTPKVEVDDLDLALLRALAVDARQSQRALARAVEHVAARGRRPAGPAGTQRRDPRLPGGHRLGGARLPGRGLPGGDRRAGHGPERDHQRDPRAARRPRT